MPTTALSSPWRCRITVTLLSILIFLVACKMDKIPHKIPPHLETLAPFDPHIATFECQTEASKTPPIDAQADDWFLEARAMEDGFTFVDDRDYKKIIQLTRQAAERHHWKAMLNLASLYLEKHDPPNGAAEAVELVSRAMELGVPAAYDRMGTYYLNGTGVNGDHDRAYAFFQKAAAMGNPHSMGYLGEKIDAGKDDLKPGYWGNIPIATKMFECALAQGYGPAAEELEYMYDVPRTPTGAEAGPSSAETRNRVLRALHEGVRGGCKFCSDRLWIEFDHPRLETMFVPFIDKARAKRYDMLGDALSFNPDRRFPNLDKILPLPPAPLPPWDGTRDSLLAAAMAVVPIGDAPAPTDASRRQGRYFLDSVYTFRPVAETTVTRHAPFSSYWQPTAPSSTDAEERAFLAKISPGLYGRGELFDQPQYPHGMGTREIVGIVWQRVLTVRNNGGAVAPRTALRLSREVKRPIPHRECNSRETCPVTGTWQPWLPPGHALEQAVNQAWRQRWLSVGQPFPDPKRDWMLPLNGTELKWHLLESEMPAQTP